ncbi:hypothetical protein DVU_0086 [Nitratidesulfovibrio vulgaris str. Hildenborough]|uniref:Uncharacterized protein n=1 Tax=Nitratidesulfovibrio vulgaris (strain ATCC 29579 / DSM 644 / CCUG 34227 / NCIMB 8303 / VKM B-1760 / Hildenborough) TaxID=882 RepID=Q72FX7_NITV2|nr:hypothetical protein DVU_0086 [Nitratidesulfovibrio vulgaris str. Hildenborough]
MQPSSSRRSLLGLFTPRRQRLFAATSHFPASPYGKTLGPNGSGFLKRGGAWERHDQDIAPQAPGATLPPTDST